MNRTASAIPLPLKRLSSFQFVRLTLIAAIALIFLNGCYPEIDTPGVGNRGILPLSTSNPYLGSNLFLAKQMERSTYLLNFMKTRGAPVALELIEGDFNPPHMLLFYPRDKEVFAAELIKRRGSDRAEWIIRGPYQIEREDYRQLASMEIAMAGEPLFVIRGRQQRFLVESQKDSRQVVTAVLPPIPTPTPKPKVKKPSAGATPTPVPDEDPQKWVPINTDQQALRIAQGFAERNDAGDAIVRVNSTGLTMEMIARWYTKDPSKAAEIAELNKLPASGFLPLGSVVRVPLMMLKTSRRIPDNFK